MAMPKKGSRKIQIGNDWFRWKVTGNDGWIDLYVEDAEVPGSLLRGRFDYETTYKAEVCHDGTRSLSMKQGTVVSSGAVELAVRAALEQGWQPRECQPRFFWLKGPVSPCPWTLSADREQTDEEQRKLFAWMSGDDS
jgi:hypothetical protein